ncbi:MAG: Gfo/Idh/MocA family oxidoreductase [Dehalococcoidia bacterium]|nr:Gfo/Idh/MocA family oxidoreductase [Dehalococcoidia bacterium]MDW8007962.1 Gfo/Idh/MocA family oxidoreductase [Chloroflexota bacterium]
MRIGLVGCGYWGSKHLRVLHELGRGVDVVIADSDRDRLEQLARVYPSVGMASDYDELLERCRAVIIATPPASHYGLARRALLADRHVLVEKPFTTSSSQARELVELAQRRRLVLMVGHTFLYSPPVRALRAIVQEGRLGRVLHLDSQRLGFGLLQPDIHVLWDLASHDIAILAYLLGQWPRQASAWAAHHLGQQPHWEVGHAHLRFPDGASAHVHASWLCPYKVRQLTVVGSRASIVYDDTSPEPLRLCERQILLPEVDGQRQWVPPSYRWGDAHLPHVPLMEPLLEEDAEFLRCIEDGSPPLSDGHWGLRVVQVLEALDRSLACGGLEVEVEGELAPIAITRKETA